MNDNIHTIHEDGTLSRKGKICLCVYDEGSCSMDCMAVEERGKGRVHLHCINREIVAHPAAAVPTLNISTEPCAWNDDKAVAPTAKKRKGGKAK